MSKSTPLSQLPQFAQMPPQPQPQSSQQPQPQPQPQFVNDQHRHMVAQAQQAAQVYSLPQSSTLDIAGDDDATVQEALQFVTGSSQPPSIVMPLPAPAPHQYPVAFPTATLSASSAAGGMLQLTENELKVILLATGAFLLASLIPVAPLIERYLATYLVGVPRPDLFLRTAICGIAAFVALRMGLLVDSAAKQGL